MAQVIMCDAPEHSHAADWMVTHLDDGDVRAYCDTAYLELMTETVEAVARAEADQTDAEALARLEATAAPDMADEPELTREAIVADLADGLAAEGMDRQEAQEYAQATTPAEGPPDLDTDPAHVIRRGLSARAIAYREREAEREAAQGPVATAEPGPGDGEPGDDDDDVDGHSSPA